VNKLTQFCVTAALAVACSTAYADAAETKGGLKIKTDDGRFEMSIGGRIHFDADIMDTDDGSGFGSDRNAPSNFVNKSGAYVRRVYLTLKGKAYGWNYKIEPDFCGAGGVSTKTTKLPGPDNTAGTPDDITVVTSAADLSNTCREVNWQDVYISTDVGPGELLFGQRKALRSMEELTSSNDILLIDRPYVSASGTFAGREFVNGVFYLVSQPSYGISGGFASLHSMTSDVTEGTYWGVRGTYTPLNTEGSILHIGASYSGENPHNSNSAAAQFRYFGRLGINQTLAATTSKDQTFTGELAGAFGPFFFQAEYGNEKFDQSAGAPSQTVDAWYIQSSYFLTGETKPYKTKEAVFTTPKPKHDFGAIELVARYEQAKNKDAFGACSATATEFKVSDLAFGANYYVNPNVRFMLNYILGKQDRGAAGSDEPKTLAARAQFSF